MYLSNAPSPVSVSVSATVEATAPVEPVVVLEPPPPPTPPLPLLPPDRFQASPPRAGPPVRLLPPTHFDPANEAGVVAAEHEEIAQGPGFRWNLHGDEDSRLADVRAMPGRYTPGRGVTAVPGGALRVVDVPNPSSPDGRWDPHEFMPHFLFGEGEDNFPVRPSFDGNASLDDNVDPEDPNAQVGYQDGVIGGQQALNAAFTVTRRGPYYIQTFSFYSAKDKGGGSWHPNDYHTAQVYLRPGADGTLEPEYLLTSFHHGTVLTRWEDVQKDGAGAPLVEVKRGTHALRPLGHDAEVPTGGLEILGDGSARFAGEPLEQRLTVDAFQSNVDGAHVLEPGSVHYDARREMMEWGDVSLRPLDPTEVIFQSLLPL